MSTDFVTSSGLVLPTLAEIKEALETSFKVTFGEDIDISPTGPFGQFVDLMSKSISDAYLACQEIYTARHPNEATGTSLDNISAETGFRRIDASATRVDEVVLYGTEGTIVPAGKSVRRSDETLLYELDADVLITQSAANDTWLEPNDLTVGLIYQVTISHSDVLYEVGIGDTKGDIIDGLVAKAILEDPSLFISEGGTFTNENDTFLRVTFIEQDYSILWNTYLDLEKVGSAGDFTAESTGPNSLPASSLTVIATPVSGWDEVSNPLAGTTGREVETDAEFRIRRAASIGAGSATDEAIRNKLLNTIEGVTAASVVSNRTLSTDIDGRPAKSFESVVEGGTDAEIAETIWINMPSGIATFGTETEIVVDSEGNNQTINFSRPSQKYLHVKVKRALNPEENYPIDGDDAIKEAIVAWSLTQYDLGTDVIYQKIAIPVYSVEGIASIEISVDLTAAPGDTPTYASVDIAVTASELAIAAQSRIVVETL